MNDQFSKSKTPSTTSSGDTPAATERLGLEEIVHLANKAGLEYAAAKKELDYCELMKSSIRAQIMIRLDDGSMSETKLKRLTEIDPEYLSFLERTIEARNRTDKTRIRYESYKNLFEAKRSLLSFQKAEMKIL